MEMLILSLKILGALVASWALVALALLGAGTILMALIIAIVMHDDLAGVDKGCRDDVKKNLKDRNL